MTLVYQSFRTRSVPQWINNCLNSVRNWAAERGYEYEFIDDQLFDYAPQWYRKKVKDNVQLVSDLSRLVLAQIFLQKGYDRVIWMDADLLIFDPEKFEISSCSGASFCRETWIDEDHNRNIVYQEKINNSVSVFLKGNALLEFYIDACLKLVSQAKTTPHVLVGTTFLTALQKIYPVEILHNIGIICPALAHDLVYARNEFLEKYLKQQSSTLHAANLCGSMKNKFFRKMEINDAVMEKVVAKLLTGRIQ